jgi:uncharacterized protein (DUF488 family)
MTVFTIGHSNYSLEDFLLLLSMHHINALGDVRSHPYSRYLPHFNKDSLQESLKINQIAYVFLGKELGARTNNLSCYINGKAVYELIANTEDFKQGLERICQGAKKYNIALMCAEKDPITCHRSILVSRHLQNLGLEIKHILQNGELESHQSLEERLLILHKFKPDHNKSNQDIIQLNLFESLNLSNNPEITNLEPIISEEEMINQAYQLQGDKIAYVDKQQREVND